jgi:hypothetical protein
MKIKRLIFLLVLQVFAVTATAQSQEQEFNLKAVFIYNFTKYIEWESDPNSSEFIIGIVGYSGIDKPISEISKLYLAKNKRIVIRHFIRPEEIGTCHILFIPKGCPYSLSSVLDRVGKGTLTVSEESGYAKQGTAFNFFVSNEKIKFEANLKAIYAAGLKAGAQLLKLAQIVD